MSVPAPSHWTPADFCRLAEQLGVQAQTPYALPGAEDECESTMFLPDFASPQGAVALVIDMVDRSEPQAARERRFWQAATHCGLWCSKINNRGGIDEDYVKDTLDDWGYYGPAERRPAWYTGTPWSKQPPRPRHGA